VWLTQAEKKEYKMKKLFYRLASRRTFAKLFSLLAIVVFELSFVPRASADLPMGDAGGLDGGWHHHFVDYKCNWPVSGGDWTPDPVTRTVTQDIQGLTCNFTDLISGPPGVPAGSGTFSVHLVFTIPSNAAGQLSGITQCSNNVRTYTAYCEQAMQDKVTGSLTLQSFTPDASTVLTRVGCNPIIGCTWQFGATPTTTTNKGTFVDTSRTGCPVAYPAASIQIGGPPVNLATNQMLLYSEEFTGGPGGQCTGTVAPIQHASRACISEANAPVTATGFDCNRVGNGNNTSFHVVSLQNTGYLFNVENFQSTSLKVGDATNCSNSGTNKFSVGSEPLFRPVSFSGVDPFNPASAPTLTVIGATGVFAAPIQATSANVSPNGNRVDLFYNQCAMGDAISSIPGHKKGDTVTIQLNGQTNAGTQGGNSISITGTTQVSTN
jgi:hypothetical protein